MGVGAEAGWTGARLTSLQSALALKLCLSPPHRRRPLQPLPLLLRPQLLSIFISIRALNYSIPVIRTPSPDPSAFPFLMSSGLFLTLPPYTPTYLYVTPGSSQAHPLPLRHEADPGTHSARPNLKRMGTQRWDCRDARTRTTAAPQLSHLLPL